MLVNKKKKNNLILDVNLNTYDKNFEKKVSEYDVLYLDREKKPLIPAKDFYHRLKMGLLRRESDLFYFTETRLTKLKNKVKKFTLPRSHFVNKKSKEQFELVKYNYKLIIDYLKFLKFTSYIESYSNLKSVITYKSKSKEFGFINL